MKACKTYLGAVALLALAAACSSGTSSRGESGGAGGTTSGATGGGASTSTSTSSATGTAGSGCGGATPYVQPGTQGYRGALSDLTTYSAANGQVPPGTSCSWQSYGLRCDDADLTLDHVYVQGGLYWTGCGNLSITNSIFDWYPGTSWYDVYGACASPNAGATVTASSSTFRTSPTTMVYTGESDVGGIWVRGDVPMLVDHSLFQGFPQGLDPAGSSVIKCNEIYTQDAQGTSGPAHGDGLFSQGGDDIQYLGNYIVTPSDDQTTSAIFYQSTPNSTGSSVIGNYLEGGAYTLYNENSNGLVVEDNTFGGYTYGDCFVMAGASWGTWQNNLKKAGGAVTPSGMGCN